MGDSNNLPSGNYKFNKGALYNIGFIETQRFGTWDCLVFHDVDLIPLDERLLYTCPRNPIHMSPAVESNNFTLQYYTLFGGVTAMSPRHYLAVNGYSNYYWDWGGEDDDMFNRLVGARLSLSRLNSTIARFATLPHKPQLVNPNRYKKLAKARNRYKSEGLKTVQYRLITIFKKRLYTHILTDVNPFNYKH
ncbi:unnamed protein product [Diatraea saccharalis]|uniref:Uncharacterized protein n=1 Tax=Diatraea saccharalis TaxID=40085 RepID=A0A9N9R2B8_9NEOP|nr:unnamed protein product [Diatraea saccharalis]